MNSNRQILSGLELVARGVRDVQYWLRGQDGELIQPPVTSKPSALTEASEGENGFVRLVGDSHRYEGVVRFIRSASVESERVMPPRRKVGALDDWSLLQSENPTPAPGSSSAPAPTEKIIGAANPLHPVTAPWNTKGEYVEAPVEDDTMNFVGHQGIPVDSFEMTINNNIGTTHEAQTLDAWLTATNQAAKTIDREYYLHNPFFPPFPPMPQFPEIHAAMPQIKRQVSPPAGWEETEKDAHAMGMPAEMIETIWRVNSRDKCVEVLRMALVSWVHEQNKAKKFINYNIEDKISSKFPYRSTEQNFESAIAAATEPEAEVLLTDNIKKAISGKRVNLNGMSMEEIQQLIASYEQPKDTEVEQSYAGGRYTFKQKVGAASIEVGAETLWEAREMLADLSREAHSSDKLFDSSKPGYGQVPPPNPEGNNLEEIAAALAGQDTTFDQHSHPEGYAAKVLETVRNRGSDYGTPAENHQLTADLLTSWFARKSALPITITAEDVCMFNVLQKISRLAYSSKNDSYLDIAGYVENVSMLRTDQRKRR